MENDFYPSEMIKKAATRWWVILGLMLIGASAGLVITRIHKPVYQSQAVITTSINYNYTGRLEDYELDHLILSIGDVIDSSGVHQAVVDAAVKDAMAIAPEKILNELTLIRKGYDWILSTRAADPVSAQKISQWWADAAMKALLERKQNSLKVFHYQVAMLAVEECFSQSVVVEPVSSSCSTQELAELHEILSSIDQLPEPVDYRESLLISNLSFELTTTPVVSTTPILFRQNLNVLAGAFIGLIVGLAWLIRGKA